MKLLLDDLEPIHIYWPDLPCKTVVRLIADIIRAFWVSKRASACAGSGIQSCYFPFLWQPHTPPHPNVTTTLMSSPTLSIRFREDDVWRMAWKVEETTLLHWMIDKNIEFTIHAQLLYGSCSCILASGRHLHGRRKSWAASHFPRFTGLFTVLRIGSRAQWHPFSFRWGRRCH